MKCEHEKREGVAGLVGKRIVTSVYCRAGCGKKLYELTLSNRIKPRPMMTMTEEDARAMKEVAGGQEKKG